MTQYTPDDLGIPPAMTWRSWLGHAGLSLCVAIKGTAIYLILSAYGIDGWPYEGPSVREWTWGMYVGMGAVLALAWSALIDGRWFKERIASPRHTMHEAVRGTECWDPQRETLRPLHDQSRPQARWLAVSAVFTALAAALILHEFVFHLAPGRDLYAGGIFVLCLLGQGYWTLIYMAKPSGRRSA